MASLFVDPVLFGFVVKYQKMLDVSARPVVKVVNRLGVCYLGR